jgi:hypothetical protein
MQDIHKGPNQHQGNYIKHVPKKILFAQNKSIGQLVLKTRVICSLEEHVVHKMGPLLHQSNCMRVKNLALLLNYQLSQKLKLIGKDKFNHLTITLTLSLTCELKLHFNR